MNDPAFLQVAAAGHRAPSADNTQPWRFEWHAGGLDVRYAAERVAGQTFPALDPGTLLSLGAVSENMQSLLEAAELPYGVTMGALTDPGALYFSLAFEAGKTLTPGRDLPLWTRHTNRFPFEPRALPAPLLGALAPMREQGAALSIFDSAPDIEGIAALVAGAAAIRFQTREVHEWLAASLRFTPEEVERGDGLDVRTIDLPPGGGLFLRLIADWRRMELLNRIGAYKALAKIDGAPVSRAPALILITSDEDAGSVFSAGRLMVRVWNRLNAEGVAVQPYYVIPDMLERHRQGKVPTFLRTEAEDLAGQAERVLGIAPGRRPRMLLRIGYPKRDPARSRRIPLDRVLAGR